MRRATFAVGLVAIALVVILMTVGTASAAEIGLSSILYPEGKNVNVPIAGTQRAPAAQISAIVRHESGQSTIEIRFKKIEPAVLFGGDVVSYVVWAVTPAGEVENIGQIANLDDKGAVTYSTRKRNFALMITAEPIITVRNPSDLVLFFSGTPDIKNLQPTAFTFDGLQTREGLVTRERESIAGMRYKKGEIPLALTQAEKAVELMDRFDAKEYDPKTYDAAMAAIAEARDARGGKLEDASSRTIVLAGEALVETFGRRQAAEAAAAEAAREAKIMAEKQALAGAASGLKSQLDSTTAEKGQLNAQLSRTEAELNRSMEELTRTRTQLKRMEADRARLSRQYNALTKELTGAIGKMAVATKTDRGYLVSLAGGAFPSGKSKLTTDAKYVLAKLSGMLLVFPDMKLSIEGHTDATGSDQINNKLSQQRAVAVRTFLTEMGVPATRIAARGLGSRQPIAPNDTSEGRAKNRRVDIVLTEGQ